MICSNCKAECATGAEFCRGCGNLLAVPAKTEAARGWYAGLGPERTAAAFVAAITLAAILACWTAVLFRQGEVHLPQRTQQQQSPDPAPQPAIDSSENPRPVNDRRVSGPASPLSRKESPADSTAPQQLSSRKPSPVVHEHSPEGRSGGNAGLFAQPHSAQPDVSPGNPGPAGITVRQPEPLIVAFAAEPAAITPGDGTVLHWSVDHSTSVKIDPEPGEVQASGQTTVSPQQTTQYILTAEGPGGKKSAQVQVRVAAVEPPAVFFEVVPASIKRGQAAELRWSTQNADRVSIEPAIGPQSRNGSISIAPQSTTQYTLTADGPGGSFTKETLISVLPPGPTTGEIIWTGNVHGVQLVTIDNDQADSGSLEGALPGLPCIIQPLDERHVAVASSPGPRNHFARLVLRVTGNGQVRVVIKWSLQ